MATRVEKPSQGLAIDPQSGFPIQYTGFREDGYEWIKMRDKAGEGVISNSLSEIDGIFTNGIIDVSDITELSMVFDLTLGSLTSFTIAFGAVKPTALTSPLKFNHIPTISIAASVGTITFVAGFSNSFIFLVDGIFLLRVPLYNVGLLLPRIQSVGTTTGSSLGVWIGRGNGDGFYTYMEV